MILAKQSTARTITVGPILDEDGVAKTDEVVANIKASKNGGAYAGLDGSATLTHSHTGNYRLALTADDFDTLGVLELTLNSGTNAMAPVQVMVMPANVWDSLVGGSDQLEVDVTHKAGGKYKIADTTGNWSTAGTWADGSEPVEGDSIIIRDGVTVTVAASLDLGQFGPPELQGDAKLRIFGAGVTVPVIPRDWVISDIANSAVATANYGIIEQFSTEVGTNYNRIIYNKGGTLASNANGAIVDDNPSGATITNNSGFVNNAGTIATNKAGGRVNNTGTVTTNDAGGIVHNYGGTVGTDNGTTWEHDGSAYDAIPDMGTATNQGTLATAITSIQNNTRCVRVVPAVIERPDSGTTTYRIELLLYDTEGNMEAPDAAPTIALVNQSGTDRSGRLDSTTMAAVSTGRYRAVYTASDSDDVEQLVWTFSVVEGGTTLLYGNTSIVVDTTAVDFTAADRTKLEGVYNKLPSKSYLTGTANSDGDVQLDEATGTPADSAGVTTLQGYTDTLEASATALQSTVNTIAGYTDSVESTLSTVISNQTTMIAALTALPAAVWGYTTRTLTSLSTLVSSIAAAVWAYATRTLTTTPSAISSQVSGSSISQHRGDTWSFQLTGLGSVSGRVKLWFTVKNGVGNPTDADSMVQILLTEPADDDDGLQYLNGAVAADASQGSLTVDDEDAGDITITIAAAATAVLSPGDGYVYDIQVATDSATTTLSDGSFAITEDVTRATS